MNLKMFIKNGLNILFTTFDCSKNLIFKISRKSQIARWLRMGH